MPEEGKSRLRKMKEVVREIGRKIGEKIRGREVEETRLNEEAIKRAKSFQELGELLKGDLKDVFRKALRGEISHDKSAAEFLEYEFGEEVFLKFQELYEMRRGLPSKYAKANAEVARELIMALKTYKDPYSAFVSVLKGNKVFRVNKGEVEEINNEDLLNLINVTLKYKPQYEDAYKTITSFAGIRALLRAAIENPEIFSENKQASKQTEKKTLFSRINNGLKIEIKSNKHELQDRVAIVDKGSWKLVAAIDGISGQGGEGTEAAEAWKRIFENLNLDIDQLKNLNEQELVDNVLDKIKETAKKLGYKDNFLISAVFSAAIKFKDKEGRWNVLHLWYGDGGFARFDQKRNKYYVLQLFHDKDTNIAQPIDVAKHEHPFGNIVAHPLLSEARFKNVSEADYRDVINGSSPLYFLSRLPEDEAEPIIIVYTDGMTDAFFGWLKATGQEDKENKSKLFNIFLTEVLTGRTTRDELITYALLAHQGEYNDDISLGLI